MQPLAVVLKAVGDGFGIRTPIYNTAHLTLEQRYEISAFRSVGFSQVEIAKKIGKHKSVICRELKRNSDGGNGEYRAPLAQRKAEKRVAAWPYLNITAVKISSSEYLPDREVLTLSKFPEHAKKKKDVEKI